MYKPLIDAALGPAALPILTAAGGSLSLLLLLARWCVLAAIERFSRVARAGRRCDPPLLVAFGARASYPRCQFQDLQDHVVADVHNQTPC